MDDDVSFKFAGQLATIDNTWKDVYTTPVRVTSGRSCCGEDQGYKIHLDQTIAAFFSKAFPDLLQVKLRTLRTDSDSGDESMDTIIVQHGKEQEAQISFVRTARVSEDGIEHVMPINQGHFQLYDVESFSGKLPVSVVAQGGIFLGMQGMCSEQKQPRPITCKKTKTDKSVW